MVRTACFYSYQVNLNCDMHVNIFIVQYLSDYNGAPFYTPYECLLVTYIFSQPGCFIVNSLHIVYEYTVVELLKLFLAMCNLIFFTICQFLNDCNCKEMHACVPFYGKNVLWCWTKFWVILVHCYSMMVHQQLRKLYTSIQAC